MPLGVRVTVIEPGAVATELPGHNRPEVLEQMAKRFEGVTPLERAGHRGCDPLCDRRAGQRVVNEVLIRPSGQAG